MLLDRKGKDGRLTALFCANDLLALGFLQAMAVCGLRVPEDMAIVGYDDIDFAAAAAIPLSSVRQPRELLGRTAIDRTAVILDIFAGHASSSEGKLQVELAQLEYNLARMRGLWTHLERLGAGIGTRGPGESQIETDRRLARDRIAALRRRLEDVKGSRSVMRAERERAHLPQVALAGYTNVGKTNLHEFAYGISSQNPHFCTVPNPIAPGRLAGGSSGGNGAALAAGLADVALGTDSGGSIRIPAAWCGIVGFKPTEKKVVTGVEMFRKLLDEGVAGDNIGVLLRGVEKDDVERGQVLAKPGSIKPHTKFKGEVYILSKDEGGRHTPFFNGYRPQFYIRTTDVTGSLKLPEGVEMVMPGDNTSITAELHVPVALEKGARFAIREGGRTVGSGTISEIIE